MGYWKTKVLPKIKKAFALDKSGKKAAAAESCKSFDDSKEEISKEVEEKKDELKPKVTEVYEASSAEIKTLVKDRTAAGVKNNSVAVTKFLEELVKIEFPGSKAACEAATNIGPAYVSGPVLFVLEKVSTFVITEEPPAGEPPVAEESSSKEPASAETTEEKKEEIEKVEEVPPPPPAAEEKKEEEAPVTAAAPPEEPPKTAEEPTKA